MQERRADQIRSVARAELSHRLCPVALECARTDLHAERALLVRIALADQLQNLALAFGQGLLAGVRRKHGSGRATVPIGALASSMPSGPGRRDHRRTADLLDDGAYALGLPQRVLDHLLQMIAFAPVLRKAVAVMM